jgi:hypothetical protein
MSVIGGAGAAVCGLCGVAVPGCNVAEICQICMYDWNRARESCRVIM